MKFPYPLKWLHIYAGWSFVIFFIVFGLEKYTQTIPEIVTFYLNDFLIIPMVGLACLHGVWFLKKDYSIRLNVFMIVSLAVLFSVYFEWYLPKVSERYTADFWDVICYAAGGVVFHFLQKLE